MVRCQGSCICVTGIREEGAAQELEARVRHLAANDVAASPGDYISKGEHARLLDARLAAAAYEAAAELARRLAAAEREAGVKLAAARDAAGDALRQVPASSSYMWFSVSQDKMCLAWERKTLSVSLPAQTYAGAATLRRM